MTNNYVSSRRVENSEFRTAAQTLKTVGEGMVTALPDRAVITVGVVTEDKLPTKAQEQNAEAVLAIIAALMELGIPREQLKTVSYRMNSLYDYMDGKQIFKGYQVTHLLEVTVNNAQQAGAVIDTAVKNGATTVSDIQFTVSDPSLYYNQALSAAINNAQQKADSIAKTLGITVNKIPIHIQEVSRGAAPFSSEAKLYAASSPPPIQPGEWKISSSVLVEYSYV
jgi:uncharacterized protein YggE